MVVLCTVITWGTATAQQGSVPVPGTIPAPASVNPQGEQELRTEIDTLKQTIARNRNQEEQQLKEMDARLALYVDQFKWLFGLFGVFIAIFGFIPVYSAMRSNSAADRRAQESHLLAIGGEKDSQKRATQIHSALFESSKDTLTLVNDTLRLAKDASDRAANIIQRRADELLLDLDSKSRTLVNIAYSDDRGLVTNPKRRSQVGSLASKIHGFENNRFILPVDVALTPACQFIRGLDFHLKQQFDDAFEAWDAVTKAKSVDASDQLKSLAWYWIGYENNNIGNFDEAETNFSHAEMFESGPRRFELQRIRVESRFFNVKAGLAVKSIPSIKGILDAVSSDNSDQVNKHKISVIRTYGNILLQAGREESAKENKTKFFKEAEAVFQQIARVEGKWAAFGLGQALWYQGRLEDANEYLRIARRAAQQEDVDRIEPRTKVLARTTELVCCVLIDEFGRDAPAVYGNLINALGMVEDTLTVYSQIQKRNVYKDQFEGDLKEFAKETDYRGNWLK
jgi:tetratricopeptide (TPR) repeat protein